MNSKFCHAILVITLIYFTCFVSSGQTPRFNAGIVCGLNFAELEGNGITDYIGLNTGIIGTAKLSKHSQLAVEILFSQNGEYILPKFYPALQYGQIWLNHVELPIHIDWLVGELKKGKFYVWNLNIGIAYTRLLGYNVETIEKVNVDDRIVYDKKEALLLQAGTTYHLTKNCGLNFKASMPIRIQGLSWTLAARFLYIIK